MKRSLIGLKREILSSQKDIKNALELYQLLSTYNAYCTLLLKAKAEYECKDIEIDDDEQECYQNQFDGFFSQFKRNECLSVTDILDLDKKDMLFLVDQDTLLRINSLETSDFSFDTLLYLDYEFLRINNCIAKAYKDSIYHGDPYYCDKHFDETDAFGLFYQDRLITPGYSFDKQLTSYVNKDIRKILKPVSIDEIYGRITEVKNNKVKKLVLKLNNTIE